MGVILGKIIKFELHLFMKNDAISRYREQNQLYLTYYENENICTGWWYSFVRFKNVNHTTGIWPTLKIRCTYFRCKQDAQTWCDFGRLKIKMSGQKGNSDPVILATAGYDHTIRFWQAHTGICYRTVQHPDSVSLDLTHCCDYILRVYKTSDIWNSVLVL